MSYVSIWRNNRYKEAIKSGKIEAIPKYINNSVRSLKKNPEEVLKEIKELNPTAYRLWKTKVLEKFIRTKVCRGKEVYKGFGLIREAVKKVIRVLIDEDPKFYEELIAKEKEKALKTVKRFSKYYFKTSEEARSVMGEYYYYALRNGTDPLQREGKVYYFEAVGDAELKRLLNNLKAYIEDFLRELKTEIALAEKYWGRQEAEYLLAKTKELLIRKIETELSL